MVPSRAVPVAVNIDGQLFGRDDARVSVFDHGFLFGEGVYEVLRTYDQRPFLFDEHMRRLHASASRLALSSPIDDAAMLARVKSSISAAALEGEAYVRILLTRGVGDIVYDPQACPAPTLVIIVKPHVDAPAAALRDGVRLALVDIVRNHPGSVDPAIKSNNLLNNALAMQQAYRDGAFEALMKNHRGELCECAQSNIFLVRDGVLLTPPTDAGLLVGVTRGFVIELAARLEIPVEQRTLLEPDLSAADEAFLTSTTREIVPVVQVGSYTVGRGTPGLVTGRLMTAFRDAVPARLS